MASAAFPYVPPPEPRQWHAGEVIPVSSTTVFTKVSEPVTLQPSLKDMIAFEIGGVPEVAAVFTKMEDRILHVWTVLRDGSRAARRAVYAREQMIVDRTEHLDFDFNVVNGGGVDPRSMFSEDGLELAFLRE